MTWIPAFVTCGPCEDIQSTNYTFISYGGDGVVKGGGTPPPRDIETTEGRPDDRADETTKFKSETLRMPLAYH